MTLTVPALEDHRRGRALAPWAVRRTAAPPAKSAVPPHAEEVTGDTANPGGETSPRPERAAAPAGNYQTQNLVEFAEDFSESTREFEAEFRAAQAECGRMIRSDAMTSFGLRIAGIQFGGGRVEKTGWVPGSEWEPRDLLPRAGDTPLGQAILDALALIRGEAARLRQAGVPINRKILFILTDGGATDHAVFESARAELQKAERDEKLFVFPVALGRHVPEIHRLSCKREAAVLKQGCFRELFAWTADLLARVSSSNIGDEIPLGSIEGWARMKG